MVDRTCFSRRRTVKAIGVSIGSIGLAGCTGGDSDGSGSDGGSSGGSSGSPGGGSDGSSTGGNSDVLTWRMQTSNEDTAAYQMSQALAAIINENSDRLRLDARPATSSEQNMRLIDQGDLEIGYNDMYSLSRVINNEGVYEENPLDTEFRQLFHFYSLQTGFLTTEGTGIQSVTDFPGKSVAFLAGTTMADIHTAMLEFVIDPEEIEKVSIGYSEEPGAMAEGRLDAGIDTKLNRDITPSYIKQKYQTLDDLWLVDWPDELVSQVEEDPRLSGSRYGPDELESRGWGDREEVFWPEAMMNTLIPAHLDEELVNHFLTVVWDNKEDLTEYHALAEYWTQEDFWTSGISDLVPVHPGATAFYEDNGFSL